MGFLFFRPRQEIWLVYNNLMDRTFENGIYYSPGRKVLWYFVFTKLLAVIILFVILGLGVSFFQGSGAILPIIIIVGILACCIVFLIAWLKYKSVKFMLDDFSFHVQKGIFSKSDIAIPYKQIQNVNQEQSFNEKMLHIAHVIIETAGTDESQSNAKSEGVLPILDSALAVSLERELLQKTSNK
jgi:uncharacterized membrane protein YdbT with pleckstrin-like domain